MGSRQNKIQKGEKQTDSPNDDSNSPLTTDKMRELRREPNKADKEKLKEGLK